METEEEEDISDASGGFSVSQCTFELNFNLPMSFQNFMLTSN